MLIEYHSARRSKIGALWLCEGSLMATERFSGRALRPLVRAKALCDAPSPWNTFLLRNRRALGVSQEIRAYGVLL